MNRFHSRAQSAKNAPRSLRNRSTRVFQPTVDAMEQRMLLATLTVAKSGAEYSTIQAAINNAKPNDEIDVAAGTYQEQLTINKSLKIVGAGQGASGTIIQSPSILNADTTDGMLSIVTIFGTGVSVDLGSVTVAGPPATGYHTIDNGIFVRGNANANIHNDTITDIREDPGNGDPVGGDQQGIAIEIGYSGDPTVGTATIINDTIVNYQKNGITVDGAGSNATITGNTITGIGDNKIIGQNGIQVSFGAIATITSNLISGNEYSGSGGGPDLVNQTQAAGIILYQAASGTTAANNTIYGNDVGIYSNSTGNVFLDSNRLGDPMVNRYAGIFLDQGNTSVTGNQIFGGNVGVAAIAFTGNTADTVGTLSGNTLFNLQAIQVIDQSNTDNFTVSLVAHNNNLLAGNSNNVTTNGPVVDASDNYWGTVDPAEVKAKANNGVNVDYSPYQAVAFSNATLYVAAETTQVGLTGLVQEGINTVDLNGTVYVEPGTYAEQLTINKSINLEGVLGKDGNGNTVLPTIQAPATLTGDANGSLNLVTITGASTNVDLGTLTIAGPLPGHNTINTGIFVRDGANAVIHDSAIRDIRQDPLAGDQNGVGIQVGRAKYNTTGFAQINRDTITGYQKNGITVDGAGSGAYVRDGVITGAGPTDVTAQNGIQISRGAFGSISGNIISGNQYTPQTNVSTGVLLSGAADRTIAAYNVFNGNDVAIYSSNGVGSTTLNNNVIDGKNIANNYGIVTTSANPTTIAGNTITGTDTGIEVDQGPVTASFDTITGGSIGVNAVSNDGNVSLSLDNSTIKNAAEGIYIDSTPMANGSFSSIVTTDPNTFVTNTDPNAHGAVLNQTVSGHSQPGPARTFR